MALYGLMSPGGSPGVTTTGLGLALGWPREVVLAECDPAGRRVLPGFLAERLPSSPGPGLLGLAMALARDAEVQLEDYTIPLVEDGHAWLLHGIRDPRHAQQVAHWWTPLVEVFATSGVDVIADLGRSGGPETPLEVLTGADLVVMVLRPSLAQVDAAQPRLDALLGALNGGVAVALCVIGSGPYPAAQISQALFGLPVLAELPHAAGDARVLSDGARPRLAFRTSTLMRATAALGQRMRKTVEERAFHTKIPPIRAAAGGGR